MAGIVFLDTQYHGTVDYISLLYVVEYQPHLLSQAKFLFMEMNGAVWNSRNVPL